MALRVHVFGAWAILALLSLPCAQPALAGDSGSLSVTIINDLPAASRPCPAGNTLSVFVGSAPARTVAAGGRVKVFGPFSDLPGLGIQVNNWYWVAEKLPVSAGGHGAVQNPDNSGAQFVVSAGCAITQETPPWFGKGIPTYQITKVAARQSQTGDCTLTVSANAYTNAVTPGCCAPPGIGTKTCTSSQWGQTANGARWPPQ